MAIFIATGLLVSWVADRLRKTDTLMRHSEAALRQELERQVAERTAELNKEALERREAEETLRRQHLLLSTVIDRLPVGLWVFDKAGALSICNPAAHAIWGDARTVGLDQLGEFKGWRQNGERIAADDWAGARAMRLGVVTLRETIDIEGFDGVRRTILDTALPLRDVDDTVIGTITINEDVTEQLVAEAALKVAKAEAERASLAKSKFLAAASHDLRQPVQALALLLAAIKPLANTERIAKAVGMMEAALDGLNGLLASILDISRVDAGVVVPQMGCVDIGAMLQRFCDGYAPECGLKNLRLRCRCQPGLNARTDAALVERVIRNLIENAIRYTDHGGLLIGTRRRGDRLRIDIVDSGIGIPADKLTHVFEEFYQVANPARDQRQGLGLGLAIVSRLARLIGADVQVRSREGRGTCFTVTVPLDGSVHVVSGPSAPAAVVTGRRIMVIEDNPKIRSGLELLLESWSCEAVGAESGEEALEVGDRVGWRFDAIIADHRLGVGLSGTETAVLPVCWCPGLPTACAKPIP